MSTLRSILWGVVIVCISVFLASAVRIRPSLPLLQPIFKDNNPLRFILGNEESLAGSIFGPHVWYNHGGNQGTNLAPNNGVWTPVALPSNPDHLPVCFEFNFAYMINTSNQYVAYGGPEAGTTHSEDSGCPLWPYNNHYGHAFGPGFGDVYHLGTTIPTNGNSVEEMDFRQDGMYFNAPSACGGPITINSATSSNGTVTLHLASDPKNQDIPPSTCYNPPNNFACGLWSGTGNGEYFQITGATTNPLLNSTPGQVYTITGITSSTIQFAGNQTCSGTCGAVSQPFLGGPPPATLPVGVDGGVPQPEFGVANAANSGAPINWSESVNILCFPLTSCPNPNAAGCGIPGANTMQ